MFLARPKPKVETERLVLRLPVHADFRQWTALRAASREFLTPWDPVWAPDHLTRKSFTNRVYWANRSASAGSGFAFFLIRRADNALLGALTLDNIRRGPAQSGTLGYWIGAQFAREGYMREALTGMMDHAFRTLDLSRLEAACLPKNAASRGLLEGCGFKYEGVAQSYLQIGGRWRTHVLYAALRHDRRGITDAS